MELRHFRIQLRPIRRGLLRAIGWFAFVIVVASFFLVRHARAEFSNGTLEIGRQMAALARTQNADVTGLTMNGQTMRIGSAQSDASPTEVLDRYADYCQSKSSAFLTKEGPNDPEGSTRTGYMRHENPETGEGIVMCFVRSPDSKETHKEAATAFRTTGRLGAIGDLRYVYASKGESGHTLVLTAWTDSQFNIMAMLPKSINEDVPGDDFSEVPRPPSSVRVIATRAEGTPYAANVYRTTESPEKLLAFYDKEMIERGWKGVDASKDGRTARGYFQRGVVTTMNISVEKDGTYVAMGLTGVSADQKVRAPQ